MFRFIKNLFLRLSKKKNIQMIWFLIKSDFERSERIASELEIRKQETIDKQFQYRQFNF
jgi:hypothetical protein